MRTSSTSRELFIVMAVVAGLVLAASAITFLGINFLLPYAHAAMLGGYIDEFGNTVTLTDLSPDVGHSSGDNNRIVVARSESFHPDGMRHGYRFDGSSVIVYLSGFGVTTTIDGEKSARVGGIKLAYDVGSTEILSVSASGDKYLITFRENGLPHTVWLDFNSPVFHELVRLHAVDDATILDSRQEMGKYFTVVVNETTGIEYQPERR